MPKRDMATANHPPAVRAAIAVLLLLSAGSLPALGQAGPYERQRPTPEEAREGALVYQQYCVGCHGNLAKGTEDAPDLIRSVAVLRDDRGSELGPALARLDGHKRDLTTDELLKISNFLKSQVEDTARNRNPATPPNVLTGDPQAGRAYFNGEAGCSGCHSLTGDLAGIGARYQDPVDLQQRFLFPRRNSPIRVTVRPANAPAITGNLERIDDFNVSLTTDSGTYQSFRRSSALQVDLDDPLTAHQQLLDLYSDEDIHNVVTYLESVK
jgi:cytochrome c oxidase cbb3-type subunit 3